MLQPSCTSYSKALLSFCKSASINQTSSSPLLTGQVELPAQQIIATYKTTAVTVHSPAHRWNRCRRRLTGRPVPTTTTVSAWAGRQAMQLSNAWNAGRTRHKRVGFGLHNCIVASSCTFGGEPRPFGRNTVEEFSFLRPHHRLFKCGREEGAEGGTKKAIDNSTVCCKGRILLVALESNSRRRTTIEGIYQPDIFKI